MKIDWTKALASVTLASLIGTAATAAETPKLNLSAVEHAFGSGQPAKVAPTPSPSGLPCYDARIRYRITVTLEDNGKSVTASVVRDDQWHQQHLNIDGNLLLHRSIGEAIVIPIHGRLLVVSLGSWFSSHHPPSGCTGPTATSRSGAQVKCSWVHESWTPLAQLEQALGVPASSGSNLATVCALSERRSSTEVEIGINSAPLMLTFDGDPDLDSIHVLDARHLDEVFGAGVSIRRVSVKLVSDPVTTDIERRLTFLVGLQPGGLCTSRGSYNPRWPIPKQDVHYPNAGLGGGCPDRSLFSQELRWPYPDWRL